MSTLYTTPGQNNGLTALNEASLEFRVMKLEERIREMEKTLTMLLPSPKVGPAVAQTYEWFQKHPIVRSLETPTEVSSPKQASEKENAKC